VVFLIEFKNNAPRSNAAPERTLVLALHSGDVARKWVGPDVIENLVDSFSLSIGDRSQRTLGGAT
jgi:hypothetical protein